MYDADKDFNAKENIYVCMCSIIMEIKVAMYRKKNF